MRKFANINTTKQREYMLISADFRIFLTMWKSYSEYCNKTRGSFHFRRIYYFVETVWLLIHIVHNKKKICCFIFKKMYCYRDELRLDFTQKKVAEVPHPKNSICGNLGTFCRSELVKLLVFQRILRLILSKRCVKRMCVLILKWLKNSNTVLEAWAKAISEVFLPRVTNGDAVVMSKLDSCVSETAEQQVLTECYWREG